MEKAKKSSRNFLLVSIILVVISMLGAAFFQTDGGDVDVVEMNWETPSSHQLSALLFKPKNVSENNPAPGIVTSHGWFNNKEMQDMNNIE